MADEKYSILFEENIPNLDVLNPGKGRCVPKIPRFTSILIGAISVTCLMLVFCVVGTVLANIAVDDSVHFHGFTHPFKIGLQIWLTVFALATVIIGFAASHYRNRCLLLTYFVLSILCAILMCTVLIFSAKFVSSCADTLKYLHFYTYWQQNRGILLAFLIINVCLVIASFVNIVCFIVSTGVICSQWAKPGGGCCSCCVDEDESPPPPVKFIANDAPTQDGTVTVTHANGQKFMIVPVNPDSNMLPSPLNSP